MAFPVSILPQSSRRRTRMEASVAGLRLRRLAQLLAPWKLALISSAALTVLILPESSAFRSPLRPKRSASGSLQQRSRGQSCRPSVAAWSAVMDADLLLRDSIRNRDELEMLYSLPPSAVAAEDDGDMVKEDAFVPPKKDDAVAPQRKRIAKTVSPKRKKNQRSRSSTMPGFTTASDRQRAYRDGIRAYEGRTGRKLEETPEKETKRRKANGEAMYKSSASVPDSMVQFAEEIHQEERISRKEEIELGERTQEAIRLQNLFDVLESKLGREPTDGEWCAAAGKINMEAINEAIEEGLEAKNKLVTSNLRMVQSVVNTYIRNGLSAQYNAGDMMQDGILALIRAAEKFEPDRGWKFSTYAMYWVRASVKRSQISQSRIVNTPQRLYENHKRLLRVQRELMADLGRPPTRKELSEAVGMSELQVNRCITAMEQRFFSLDSEVNNRKKPNDSNKDTLVDILEAKIVDDEYSNLNRIYLREDLIETLNRHLPPEAVEILMLRYGLKDPPDPDGVFRQGKQVTIAELSRLFGLKPDKIRRIIENSLKQLKGLGTEEWLAFERELQ